MPRTSSPEMDALENTSPEVGSPEVDSPSMLDGHELNRFNTNNHHESKMQKCRKRKLLPDSSSVRKKRAFNTEVNSTTHISALLNKSSRMRRTNEIAFETGEKTVHMVKSKRSNINGIKMPSNPNNEIHLLKTATNLSTKLTSQDFNRVRHIKHKGCISPELGIMNHSPAIESPELLMNMQHSSEFQSPLDPQTLLKQLELDSPRPMQNSHFSMNIKQNGKQNDKILNQKYGNDKDLLHPSVMKLENNARENFDESPRRPRKRDVLEEVLSHKRRRIQNALFDGSLHDRRRNIELKFHDTNKTFDNLMSTAEDGNLMDVQSREMQLSSEFDDMISDDYYRIEKNTELLNMDTEKHIISMTRSNEMLDRLIHHLEILKEMSKGNG